MALIRNIINRFVRSGHANEEKSTGRFPAFGKGFKRTTRAKLPKFCKIRIFQTIMYCLNDNLMIYNSCRKKLHVTAAILIKQCCRIRFKISEEEYLIMMEHNDGYFRYFL
jgi:hypothetical protein